MNQEPRFEQLETTRLVGIFLKMSRVNDQTRQLWRSFMPRRDLVSNRTSSDFISMQVYPNGPHQVADPSAEFTKWAVVQVEDFSSLPEDMSSYTLDGGLYAVFDHNGPATDLSTIMYIFGEWLPRSEYVLDHREHFELLPADYKPVDPNAREEFWIPVKRR
jgi:AraC family transcriptional regulator